MSNSPVGAPRSRAGFTLLEVLVALAVGGLVLIGARALLVQLAFGTERIIDEAEAADRDANAERMLRRLLDQVEASDGEAVRFIGNERAARFVTWCDVPAGWQERCQVTLGWIEGEHETLLTVRLPGDELVVLRRGARAGEFRYLYSAGEGGTWLRQWESTITTPLALGLMIDGELAIVRIGERG